MACHWFRFISFKRQYVKYDNTFDNLRAYLTSTGNVSCVVVFVRIVLKGERPGAEAQRFDTNVFFFFFNFDFTLQHIREMIRRIYEHCVYYYYCYSFAHHTDDWTIEMKPNTFLPFVIIFPHGDLRILCSSFYFLVKF